MENEFDLIMSKQSDKDLIKILNSAQRDYKPEALEAAARIFKTRNIAPEEIIAVKRELEQQQVFEENRSTEPLSVSLRTLSFILPGLLAVIMAGTFKADGYNRKAEEVVKWAFYGVMFYVGLSIVIKIF